MVKAGEAGARFFAGGAVRRGVGGADLAVIRTAPILLASTFFDPPRRPNGRRRSTTDRRRRDHRLRHLHYVFSGVNIGKT